MQLKLSKDPNNFYMEGLPAKNTIAIKRFANQHRVKMQVDNIECESLYKAFLIASESMKMIAEQLKDQMENSEEEKTYVIIRKFASGESVVIEEGLTLAQAKEHCSSKETSWMTCQSYEGQKLTEERGKWFDCFYEE